MLCIRQQAVGTALRLIRPFQSWVPRRSISNTPLPLHSVPLLNRAQKFLDNIAIATPENEHTYRQLVANASTLSRDLVDATPESSIQTTNFPVAIMCPRDYSYPVAMWSVWMSGGIAVPLCNTHPAPELEYTIRDSNAVAIIVHPQYEEAIYPIAKRVGIPVLPLNDYLEGWRSGHHDALGTAQTRRSHQERAMLIYTSGTTGRPKGVLSTHSTIANQITALIDAWHWKESDRLLHTLPLHHVHGVVAGLLSALWAGAVCDMRTGFSAADVWSDLLGTDARLWSQSQSLPLPAHGQPEKSISLYMAVPTIYAKLVQYYDENTKGCPVLQDEIRNAAMQKLRLMVSGSAPLPIPVLKRWEDMTGHTLLERYGMTEIGLVLSNPYVGPRAPGSVGSTLGGVHARIVEEVASGKFADVKPGQSGELWIAGQTVFQEYWNRPEETSTAFVDGWFRTGDEAVLDNGMYRILGRMSSDVLKTGGYKVSALEIENILMENPDLAECCVVGVSDDTWGQRVAAVVVPTPGANTITLDNIQAFAKQRMAPYKVPTILRVLDAIPRNAMGKVNKKALVKELFE